MRLGLVAAAVRQSTEVCTKKQISVPDYRNPAFLNR